MTTTPFDTAWVRAQFPAFSAPALEGQAFFENAGGSYPCAQVVDRVHWFYSERKVQPHAPFAVSQLAGDEMDEARTRLAVMLGVKTHELSFGPSTSASTFLLSQAVRRWLKLREAIVVMDQDHEANSGPWRRLAEDGVEVREWRIDPATGHLNPERLSALLSDGNVRLVCFTHCSNVIGEVNDVAKITRLAHAAGARVCVDGVSYAPHGLPDAGALGRDIYLFSAYKVYGPHQGSMVIREEFGMELPNQGHFFNGDALYKRFTPAGPDHAQIAASAGIADYFEARSAHHGGPTEGGPAARAAHDLMRAREVALLQPLLDYLKGRNDIRLLGPTEATRRAPTVAIELPEPSEPVAAALARYGIMAGGGDFHAVRPLQALGIDPAKGVLRMSFTHYTSEEEVDRLIQALDGVLPG